MEWRTCPDFPNYLVSSDGKVRRVLRDKLRRCGELGRILRPSVSHGYFHVILMVNGQRHSRSVHRLVALAFLGAPPSSDYQVAHWDGNKQNNGFANLRWATPRENSSDRLRHNTMHVRTWNSKLSESDIEHIRELARSGVVQRRIAEQFGVQSAHISKIVRGLKWRQLLPRENIDPRAG
jgi:HNH endonuclease/NUMOD4 motif